MFILCPGSENAKGTLLCEWHSRSRISWHITPRQTQTAQCWNTIGIQVERHPKHKSIPDIEIEDVLQNGHCELPQEIEKIEGPVARVYDLQRADAPCMLDNPFGDVYLYATDCQVDATYGQVDRQAAGALKRRFEPSGIAFATEFD